MNPFAELSGFIPASVMQAYVVIMFLLVVGGTLFDVWHKRSAEYFFENAKKAEAAASVSLSSSEKRAVAFKTITEDVLTSAEFCNPNRRIAHLLTMYGFVAFLISTIVMVFFYASSPGDTPTIWGLLWHIGALMVCIGGYWFWLFIRVDVAAEGHPWNRIVHADLFVLSLARDNYIRAVVVDFPSLGLGRPGRAFTDPVYCIERSPVRRSDLVEVCPYVLQARCSVPKTYCGKLMALWTICQGPPIVLILWIGTDIPWNS